MANAVSPDGPTPLPTNATNAVSAIVTNAAVSAKGAASNALEKASMTETRSLSESVAVPANGRPEPSSPKDGSPWTASVLVAAAVVAVFAATRKKIRSGSPATEPEVASRPAGPRPAVRGATPGNDEIADDVLAAVAPDDPNRAALREELLSVLEGGGRLSDPVLASILRIEESFEKRPGMAYLRRVSVLRRKDGTTGSLAKVETELGWEYIPNAVRAEFIRSRGDKVVRLLYDAGKAEQK